MEQRCGIVQDRDRAFLASLWEQQILPSLEVERIAAEGDVSLLLNELADTAMPFCEAYIAGLEKNSDGGAGGRPRGSNSREDLSKRIKFDSKTETHVRAFSEYLSKIATVERRVMEFRRRYLGGPTRTVAPAEVPEILKEWSIAPSAESDDDVYLYWTGGERPLRFRGGYWSAIGTLDRLGDNLAKRYPWGKDQAMHLVLCGGVYQVKTVSGKRGRTVNAGPAAHKFNRGTITLEVEAWMSPELVKKAYSHLQRQIDQGDETLGETVKIRRGYGRTAEIFRFVVGRGEVEVVSERESLGKLVLPHSWRKLRELWDDHLPAGHTWRYGEKGERNFYRDFMRGQEAVTGSKWGIPGYPGQPMTAEQSNRAVEEMLERWGAEKDAN